MNIGIYIYNQAEVLDFSGPFEVFATASRICGGFTTREKHVQKLLLAGLTSFLELLQSSPRDRNNYKNLRV